MASTTFSIGSLFFLSVSLIRNWKQLEELDMRNTQIQELKHAKALLSTHASFRRTQLVHLLKEREQANEYQVHDGMVLKKEEQAVETHFRIEQLSKNVCRAVAPRGMVDLFNDWADESPWAVGILAKVFVTAGTALLWRLLMNSRTASRKTPIEGNANEAWLQEPLVVAKHEDENAVTEQVSDWRLLYWTRKLVVWGVAIIAFTVLPLHLRNAGVPQAAKGEAYLHTAQGWKRVVLWQVLACAADQAVMLILCMFAWPLSGKRKVALQGAEKQPSDADKREEKEEDEEDEIKPVEEGEDHDVFSEDS